MNASACCLSNQSGQRIKTPAAYSAAFSYCVGSPSTRLNLLITEFQRAIRNSLRKEAQWRLAEQARLVAEDAALCVFQYRRCPEAVPSNSKLHQYLRDRHAEKPASANQLPLSPVLAIDAPPYVT